MIFKNSLPINYETSDMNPNLFPPMKKQKQSVVKILLNSIDIELRENEGNNLSLDEKQSFEKF